MPERADWPKTVPEAKHLQRTLAANVIQHDDFGAIRYIAGTDVGIDKANRTVRGAIAVLDSRTLERVDYAVVSRPLDFPYVPGYLSFREAPVLLDALAALTIRPDLMLCDGQGYAHPRRFGLACHLGVLAGLPSVGVAKSRLIGEHTELPAHKGARVPLVHDGEIIGAVLRSRRAVRPLYISIGHRVSLDSAVDFVLRCTTRYRLPETTREADRLASGARP